MTAAELQELKEILVNACQRHPIRRLVLFGSMARSTASESSDIDLLVDFEPHAEIGLLALSRMRRELSEALGRSVDLVPQDGLKPAVAREVLRDGEVLYPT